MFNLHKQRNNNIRGKREKTMADQLMYIPNDDTQNFSFCRLKLVVETFETHHNEPANQNSRIFLKLSRRIRKRYYKTLKVSALKTLSLFE